MRYVHLLGAITVLVLITMFVFFGLGIWTEPYNANYAETGLLLFVVAIVTGFSTFFTYEIIKKRSTNG